MTIKEILDSPLLGYECCVSGWVRTVRQGAKGTILFVALCDGSGIGTLQVVCDTGCAGYAVVKCLTTGCAATFQGRIVASEGREQPMELAVGQLDSDVITYGPCDAAEYPLAKKAHSLEHLRSLPHLRPRTQFIQAVARVRSTLSYAIHQFHRERGYVYVNTPIITTMDCEGGGELFEVQAPPPPSGDQTAQFFGGPAYLTCSGQLSLEGFAMGLTRTYTFGPTFRAEYSYTSKHLSEFWMLEPEVAFIGLTELTELVADTIKYAIAAAVKDCPRELRWLEDFAVKDEDEESRDGQCRQPGWLFTRLSTILSEPPIFIPYKDAIQALKSHFASDPKYSGIQYGDDLSSEMEQALCCQIYPGRMVFVTRWPAAIKAFYMKETPGDPQTCESMDCLLPQVGEVAGGSAREDDHETLVSKIRAKGLPLEPYAPYLELRKYGSAPHAGYGLGFERLIAFVTGARSVRDTIPYPRFPGKVRG